MFGVYDSILYGLLKPLFRLVDSDDGGEGSLKELLAKEDADDRVRVGEGFGEHGGKEKHKET